MYLLPTYGQGGVISIGPFTIYAKAGYDVEVKMAVRRPQELAPAGDSKVYAAYVRRFRESFLFLDKRAFIADLDYAQGINPGYFVISTKPIKDVGIAPRSANSVIRFYVKFYDENMRNINVIDGVGTRVSASLSWSDIGHNPVAAVAYVMYEWIRSMVDLLKEAVLSFPVVGYMAFTVDAYVRATQASVKVEKADKETLMIQLYTGWYDVPLETVILYGLYARPYYFAVTRVEYLSLDPDGGRWITVFSVDRPALPYTSCGYVEYVTNATYFPYRTLMCGVQEAGSFNPGRCDYAYYR